MLLCICKRFKYIYPVIRISSSEHSFFKFQEFDSYENCCDHYLLRIEVFVGDTRWTGDRHHYFPYLKIQGFKMLLQLYGIFTAYFINFRQKPSILEISTGSYIAILPSAAAKTTFTYIFIELSMRP